ncbi:MAG TPA: hypothetical protein PLY72_15030 [Candidatus Obscuribacter sp.]|nr:hypothetical protein [Candidatus Obscuribacter sp.]HNG75780.1 hypothetical protein [Candidatus Obscuribacter sp.]
MSEPEQDGGVFQSSDSSQSGGEGASDTGASEASGTAAPAKKEQPLWYGWILWSLPIWWTISYGLLLAAINVACKSYGTSLYLLVNAELLSSSFLLFFFVAYVISLFVIKAEVATHFSTLLIWFVVWGVFSAFFGITQGSLEVFWSCAAGCPREKALEYVRRDYGKTATGRSGGR